MKYLLGLLLVLTFPLMAETWSDRYIECLNFCESKNYKEAEVSVREAIALYGPKECFFLHVRRGVCLGEMGQYQEAINEFTWVIGSDAVASDRVAALWGRQAAYANLGDFQAAVKDNLEIKKSDSKYPQVEIDKDIILIRNFDRDYLGEEFYQSFVNLWVRAGVATKEDVTTLHGNVCVIKKKSICTQCPNRAVRLTPRPLEHRVQECNYWCDRLRVVADGLCVKLFDCEPRCAYICGVIVEGIVQGCYICCSNGEFYSRCVEPFADFVSKVPCHPCFDD